MKAEITIQEKKYITDFSQPISIALPLEPKQPQVKCFFAPDFAIEAVRTENFVGDTLEGSCVNFKNIHINPHGNGTHTECVGHIAKEPFYIKDCLQSYHFLAKVISVEIDCDNSGNTFISRKSLEEKLSYFDCDALIIRTLKNDESKKHKDYSDTNPTYILPEAMQFLVEKNVQHLLIDLPSVDREQDDGKLLCHKIFWNFEGEIAWQKTITELIFVPNEVQDGNYLLQFQILNIALDASPSFPVLYKLDD